MRLPFIPLLLLLPLTAVATRTLPAQDIARGVRLFESHDHAGARAEFTAAVRRNDADARAHYWLGRLDLLRNDADAAVDHLERATKIDDTVSDYQFWYGSAIAQQASSASALTQPILARRMRAAIERAVLLDERNIDARDMLVDFYSMAPGFMGGSPEKAREQAMAIARIDAMRGHLAAGRMAIDAKDTATVEREMNAAIDLAPDSLRTYVALITWQLTTKQWPRAFATIDRYIARRPDDLHGSYQLGRAAAMSGQQLTRGETALRAFLASPPGDATPPAVARAQLRLGHVLAHQGRHADARVAFEQALKIDPRNEEAKKALKAGVP
jgi:tetratricopeptide (TPR) repeat protein